MTTTTLTRNTPASPLGRIWNVVRLQFVNPWTTVLVPAMIMAFIFLINLAIWWIIFTSVQDQSDRLDASEGISYSGAAFYIFVYMLVVAVQAMNLTFPFALGYSVTRRDYYLGTALTFVILSAGWALLLSMLAAIEEATNGWGLGGTMFTAVYFGDGGPVERFYIFLVGFLFFFFLGAATGSIYVRWRAYGMYVFFAVLAVALVAAVGWLTLTSNWQIVGDFFVRVGVTGFVTWLLVPTALSAVTGFLLLRKATPKN